MLASRTCARPLVGSQTDVREAHNDSSVRPNLNAEIVEEDNQAKEHVNLGSAPIVARRTPS